MSYILLWEWEAIYNLHLWVNSVCQGVFPLHSVFICYCLLLLCVQLFAIRMWSFLFLHWTYSLYFLFSVPVQQSPLLSITSGSNWLYAEWNAQSATFRVLYRESGAPDYQVIVPTTSQLSHNISALQPNTLYNIVVEATHTVIQDKVNSSVTRAYTTPRGKLEGMHTMISDYRWWWWQVVII